MNNSTEQHLFELETLCNIITAWTLKTVNLIAEKLLITDLKLSVYIYLNDIKNNVTNNVLK